MSLQKVVAKGKLADVQKMVETGIPPVNVNEADATTGDTALHTACSYGYVDIVKYLLDKGANLNLRNKKSKLAEDVAKNDAVKLVIEKTRFTKLDKQFLQAKKRIEEQTTEQQNALFDQQKLFMEEMKDLTSKLEAEKADLNKKIASLESQVIEERNSSHEKQTLSDDFSKKRELLEKQIQQRDVQIQQLQQRTKALEEQKKAPTQDLFTLGKVSELEQKLKDKNEALTLVVQQHEQAKNVVEQLRTQLRERDDQAKTMRRQFEEHKKKFMDGMKEREDAFKDAHEKDLKQKMDTQALEHQTKSKQLEAELQGKIDSLTKNVDSIADSQHDMEKLKQQQQQQFDQERAQLNQKIQTLTFELNELQSKMGAEQAQAFENLKKRYAEQEKAMLSEQEVIRSQAQESESKLRNECKKQLDAKTQAHEEEVKKWKDRLNTENEQAKSKLDAELANFDKVKQAWTVERQQLIAKQQEEITKLNQESQQELDQIKNQLSDAEKEKQTILRESKVSLQQVQEQTDKTLKEKEANVQLLQSKLDQEFAVAEALKSDMHDLVIKADQYKLQAETWHNENEALRKSMLQQTSELRQLLDAKEKECKTLNENIVKQKAKMQNDFDVELRDLNLKFGNETKLAQLNHQKEMAAAQAASNQKINELNVHVKELSDALQKEHADHDIKMENLNSLLQMKQGQVESMQSTLDEERTQAQEAAKQAKIKLDETVANNSKAIEHEKKQYAALVDKSNKELADLNTKLADSQKQNNDLIHKNTDLNQKLEQANAAHVALEKEKNHLLEEAKQKLADEMTKAEQHDQQLKQSHAKAMQHEKDLYNKLEQDKANEMSQAVAQHGNQLAELKSTHTLEMNNQLSIHNALETSSKQTISELQQTIAEHVVSYESLGKQKEQELAGQKQHYEQVVQDLTVQFSTERSNLLQDAENLKVSHTDQITTLQSNHEQAMRDEQARYQTMESTKNEQIQELSHNLDEVRTALAATQKQVADLETERDQHVAQIGTLESQVRQLNQTVQARDQTIQELEQKQAAATEQIRKLEEQITGYKDEVAKLTDLSNKQQAALAAKDDELTKLKSDFETAKIDLGVAEQSYMRIATQLHEQLNPAKKLQSATTTTTPVQSPQKQNGMSTPRTPRTLTPAKK